MLVTAVSREWDLGGEICFNDRDLQSDGRKALPTGRDDMQNWVFHMAATSQGAKLSHSKDPMKNGSRESTCS